jgi:uncharacterized iron-regulated membrane protein
MAIRHLAYVTPGAQRLPLQELVRRVEAGGTYQILNIGVFDHPTFANRLIVRQGREIRFAYVNPYTGQVLGSVTAAERDKLFERRIYLLHTNLLTGTTGNIVVVVVTTLTVFLTLSGLYVWWPRKIVSIKPGSSWRRVNFDLHSAVGFFGSAIGLCLSVTGLVLHYEDATFPWLRSFDSRPQPARPKVANIKGQPTRNLDELAAIADAALPGAETRFIAGPFNAGLVSFNKRFPEDRTPGGRSVVNLNQYTGEVLQVISTRQQETGSKIVTLMRSLHTGDVLGAPTQALFGLTSLSLAVQAISGILMWWKPRRSDAPSRARQTMEANA